MILDKCLGLKALASAVTLFLLAMVRPFDNLHCPLPDDPVLPPPADEDGTGAEEDWLPGVELEAGTPAEDEPEPEPELLAEVILGPVVSTDESPLAI